jgi:hypothetical protein
MGMFSEISAAHNANLIGKTIILSVEENQQMKEFVRKYFLPLYYYECSEAWGGQNKEIDSKIKEIFE